MRYAAVVLAAGESRRLGEPKQLVELAGERLLERAVRVATETGCDPVVVVLGARSEQIQEAARLGKAMVVVNEGWSEGMASSIREGVLAAAAGDVAGFVVLTCDQPAVDALHVRRLIGDGTVRVSSRYAGRSGVPAYFPAEDVVALMALAGDTGARALLAGSKTVELVGGELDIDTPEALEAARDRFGSG